MEHGLVVFFPWSYVVMNPSLILRIVYMRKRMLRTMFF